MKDIVGLGSLSVSLCFQIKSPEIFDLKIQEFDRKGERYGSSKDFQHYLDFVSRIGRKVWQRGGGAVLRSRQAGAARTRDSAHGLGRRASAGRRAGSLGPCQRG